MHRWKSASVGIMIAALATGAAIVAGRAGADKVSFPQDYATGVMYLSVDKVPIKQVHQFYAMPPAFEAARKGDPMPSGTVFTMVRYAAQLDQEGVPIKGPDGKFVKGALLGYAAMEKRTGWGSEYPDAVRNGEWEYQAFLNDKRPNASANLAPCFECHKPLARQDYVQSYDALKNASK